VADFDRNGLMYVEAAVRLEKQGFDAIIVNSFGDYGMDRVEARCRTAIASGADVILQGCTCMSPVRDAMARRLSKPVIDPLVLAQQTAEVYVRPGIRHPASEAPARNLDTLHAMFASRLPAAPRVGFNAAAARNAECEGGVCAVLRDSAA